MAMVSWLLLNTNRKP